MRPGDGTLPSMSSEDPTRTCEHEPGSTVEGATAARRSPPEDLRLVERLLAGDEDAFEALVGLHHGALLRLARVFVPTQALAEEVVQETWLAVLGGLRSFEGRASLRTWIFRILMNRARTIAVREGRSVPFSALDDPGEERVPAVDPSRFRPGGGWSRPPERWDDDTPEKILIAREAVGRLEEAIRQLPPGQRAVVTLRDIEGCDSVEVCNILGIRETNQRVLLHRARSKLRGMLEGYLEEM